jgi:hypothetical protein
MLVNDLCDQIKRDVDLVDYLEKLGHPVEIRGNKAKIVCPFKDHEERTGSFQVSQEGSDPWLFFCFGCHRGGTVIDFYRIYHNVSVGQAIKSLSQNTSVLGDIDYISSIVDSYFDEDKSKQNPVEEIDYLNACVSMAWREHIRNNPDELDVMMKFFKSWDQIMKENDIEKSREWKNKLPDLLKRRGQ